MCSNQRRKILEPLWKSRQLSTKQIEIEIRQVDIGGMGWCMKVSIITKPEKNKSYASKLRSNRAAPFLARVTLEAREAFTVGI